jgi:hypothetical protein
VSDDLRAALDRVLDAIRVPLEGGLRAHTDEILTRTAAERDAAVQQATEAALADARRQADAQIAELRVTSEREIDDVRRSAQQQIQALESRAQSLQAELETVRRQAEADVAAVRRDADGAIAAARSQADADIEDARRTAETQVEDVQRVLEQRLADANGRVEETQRALDAAGRGRDETRRALDETRRTLEETRRAHEEARRTADEMRVRTEDLRRQLTAVQAEMDELGKRSAAEAQALVAAQITAAAEAHQRRLLDGITKARNESREAALAQTRELLQGIRSLDEARSLGDALDRLARITRRGSERIAVLILKGERLTEWRTAGFADAAGSAETIDVEMPAAGVAGEAVRTGRPAVQIPAEGHALPAFARTDAIRAAAALPIGVGGTVVAVLYVDTVAAEASRDARWPATFEVLARHVSRVLEAIAVQRAADMLPARAARAGTGEMGNLR